MCKMPEERVAENKKKMEEKASKDVMKLYDRIIADFGADPEMTTDIVKVKSDYYVVYENRSMERDYGSGSGYIDNYKTFPSEPLTVLTRQIGELLDKDGVKVELCTRAMYGDKELIHLKGTKFDTYDSCDCYAYFVVTKK